MSTSAWQEASSNLLDSAWVRAQFPSLKLQVNGEPAAFLDGPAGTQVPKQVIDAVQNYFLTANANTCGAFATSRANDAIIAASRAAMSDFFHCDPYEVVFGQNMTTITFALARAIGRDLTAGDEIVVTTLDHDANVAPWRALEEKGVVIRQVDIREADCTLDLDDLKRKITAKTKLVALGDAPAARGGARAPRDAAGSLPEPWLAALPLGGPRSHPTPLVSVGAPLPPSRAGLSRAPLRNLFPHPGQMTNCLGRETPPHVPVMS